MIWFVIAGLISLVIGYVCFRKKHEGIGSLFLFIGLILIIAVLFQAIFFQ